jgi:predicted amidohydrolase
MAPRPGAAADIAVLDLVQGSFEFVDNYKNWRVGSQKLISYAGIAGGRVLMSSELGPGSSA